MADTPAPSSSGDQFGFLTKKVGPLPVWAWGVIAVGIYYWYTHYGPGANSATPPANANGNADAVTETLNTTTGPTTDSGSSTVTVPSPPPPVDTGGGTPPPVPPPPSSNPPRQVKPPNHNPPRVNEVLTGGHVLSNNPANAEIGWNIEEQSPLAQKLKVVLNGPGHKNQTRYIPANATTATFGDLESGHTYVADVTPVDAQGQAVGGPNHITFVTSRNKRM